MSFQSSTTKRPNSTTRRMTTTTKRRTTTKPVEKLQTIEPTVDFAG